VFTGNALPLSSFDHRHGLAVVRDCDFSYVGKVPTRLDRRLVACSQQRQLRQALREEGIIGIITTEELAGGVPEALGLAIAEKPQAASYRLHEALCDIPDFHWERFPTRIAPDATIHPSAIVEPFDVVIGAGSRIGPGAIICARSVIGEECAVGPGTVIGCDGFEVDTAITPHRYLRPAGGVKIDDNVEILANATVARATFGGFTRLGAESKLDCLVYVAHDCDIGRRVRIAASAEMSGRVAVGDDVFVGPNCSIANGLKIGNGATLSIGAVVLKDVAANSRVTGNPAIPHEKWLVSLSTVR